MPTPERSSLENDQPSAIDAFISASRPALAARALAVREHEAKYFLAAIVDSSQDSIITVDFEGLITSWNRAAQTLYGYSAQEAIGHSVTMLTLPVDLALILRNIDSVKHSRQVVTFDTVRVHQDDHEMNLEVVMSPVKDAQGQVIGVSTIARDITDRKKVEAALILAHDELEARVQERTQELTEALEQQRQIEAARAELMKRIVNAQEDERGRISRELHDNLGQHLTGVMLGLQALETQIDTLTGGKRLQGTPQLERLREQVDGLMKAAHRQAWELRPAELDAMGVEAALSQYILDWSARIGVPVDFQAIGWEERRPDTAIETTLYRVVQEALTNVARHANATQVSVVLELNGNGASAGLTHEIGLK